MLRRKLPSKIERTITVNGHEISIFVLCFFTERFYKFQISSYLGRLLLILLFKEKVTHKHSAVIAIPMHSDFSKSISDILWTLNKFKDNKK